MGNMENGGTEIIGGSGTPPMSHMDQAELTFLDLLLIITERKKLVGAVTATCGVIAVVLAFALPPEYTATVAILPPQSYEPVSPVPSTQTAETKEKDSSGTKEKTNESSGTPVVKKNLNDLYVSILRSQTVEDAVVRQYGLQAEYGKKSLDETRDALEEHTKINGSTKDGLIRLSFTDRDPRRSAEIANGYVGQFKGLAQRLAISEASQRRAVSQNHLEKTKADLENAYEALQKARLSTGAVKVDAQTHATIDTAAGLRGEIVAKEVQIEAMPSYSGDESPARIQAQAELDQLRKRFDKLVGSSDGSQGNEFPRNGAASQASVEYLRRLRDVRYNEATFDALVRQLELAKLDEAREGAFIQVVDPAVAPDTMSYPRRGLLMLAGLAVGFTLGMMLALLQGGLARARHNPATRGKLDLLRMSLGNGGGARVEARTAAVEEQESANTLRHARPEATGSGF